MIAYNENTHRNEIMEVTTCNGENISLMHKEFYEVREKINALKFMLEQVIDVLGGGTINTFKTPIYEKTINTNDVETVKPVVIDPEKMTLGDNITHLELMVGEAIQRVNEIKNIIGMDLDKKY